MTDASARLLELAGGHVVARAIHVAAHLRVADHLSGGPRSIDELASVTGTHEPSLYRLMRSLAGYGVFAEGEGRRFSLGPLGVALRSEAPGRTSAAVAALAGGAMWNAFGDLLHSVRTGEAVLERGRPLYDVDARPEEAVGLSDMMIGFHGQEPAAVAAGYDFSNRSVVVDVGGSTGNLLTTILLAHPGLQGIVYDLPAMGPETHRRLRSAGLAERCSFVGGSFFEAVPSGGDAYVLSHVIHDWSDEDARQILRNCRGAMGPGGRLLVVEEVVPAAGGPPAGSFLDLVLLATTAGRHRSGDELGRLLSEAGFRLTEIIPTRELVSIVEAAPV